MKPFIYNVLVILGLCAFLYANSTAEYNKAQATLDERGEVYFKFYINSPNELKENDMFNVLSIDQVNHNEVIAYANQQQFEKFVKSDFYFEVLTPPSFRVTAPMSDTYDNPETGSRFDFYRYPTYSAYLGQMNSYATNYPNLTHLDTLGETVTNNSHLILCLRVESDIDVTNGKPKYLNTSTIHGDEVLNYMNTLHMIDTMLSSYGTDARITDLMDNIDFYFCPAINPDATYLGGNNTVNGARRYNVENNFDLNRNYPDGCGNANHLKWGLQNTSAGETKIILALHSRYHFALGEDFHSGAETILWPFGFKSARPCDEDWHKYICKKFADQVHDDANNNGYLTSWCGADGMGHLYTEMYEAHGTRLDYQNYHGYGKSTTPETSNQKLLNESELRTHWGYLKEAYFQMMENLLTGLQGFITDSLTGEPIFNAKMTRNSDFDNVEVYSDSLGFYHRFTVKGTYTLTYSHEDYVSKDISNFNYSSYEDLYELNVKLWPKNVGTITNNTSFTKNAVKITPCKKGIRINIGKSGNDAKIGIYNVSGKLVKSLSVSTASDIFWNGMDSRGKTMGNGCYFVRIANKKQKISQGFILNR